jgi:hypothetical protein
MKYNNKKHQALDWLLAVAAVLIVLTIMYFLPKDLPL